jgi:hypothetical protein
MGRKTRKQRGGGGAEGENSRPVRKRAGSENNIVPYGGTTPSIPSIFNRAQSLGGSLLGLFRQTPAAEPIQQSEAEPSIEDELERLTARMAQQNPHASLLIVNDAERESIEDARKKGILVGLTREEKNMLDFLRDTGLNIQNLASCELAIREGRIPHMVIEPLPLSLAGARSLGYTTSARHSSYRG